MKDEQIKQSIDNIREECDTIEEEIEPKEATVRGDPMVTLK